MESANFKAFVEGNGLRCEFQAASKDDLDTDIALWCRLHWHEELGACPRENAECVEAFFNRKSGTASCDYSLTVCEPTPDPSAFADRPRRDSDYRGEEPPAYGPSTDRPGGAAYPIEIFVNNELAFKLLSDDADGDLAAIRALMEVRTRRRQSKPFTAMELYGVEDPHQMIFREASGRTFRIKKIPPK